MTSIRNAAYSLCRILLLSAVLFISSAAVTAVRDYPNPLLKVRLGGASGSSLVTLESASPIKAWGMSGFSGQRISAQRSGGTVKLNGRNNPGDAAFLYSKSPIWYKGLAYQGFIVLHPGSNGGLDVINYIRTEKYLEGVINAEISSAWPMEALKTQAVIARTYALHKLEVNFKKPWHLTATERDQVYKGASVADLPSYKSIRMTAGEVLIGDNGIIPAFYHSNSGGYTERTENIWSVASGFVKAKPTSFGRTDPNFSWGFRISKSSLSRKLSSAGYFSYSLEGLEVLERFKSGRVKLLRVSGAKGRSAKIKGTDLIKVFGSHVLKSLLFEVADEGSALLFTGQGFGHGIGVCQWCAKEMAAEGDNYKDILDYFYQRVRLSPYLSGNG